jgi:transcriptional regulator with XRE-family HTH domain
MTIAMARSTPSTRLKKMLKDNGLTAADLARKLEVSQPTVHAWVTGLHGMRWANARRVAKAVGVTPSWLMFGTDSTAEGTAQGAEELAMLRLWRELGEEEQAAAMRRLTAIRRKQG